MSNRLAGMALADIANGKNPGRKGHYLNVIQDGAWKGNVVPVSDALTDPFKWKKPRKVFVNSMSDLFYGDDVDRRACEAKGIPFEPVPFDFIDSVFAVMALCDRHTFQILTKRPLRMAEYLRDRAGGPLCDVSAQSRVARHAEAIAKSRGEKTDSPYWDLFLERWPLPNVHLGTSTENQKTFDERIPHLLQCPAVVRFLSAEPLLGPIEFSNASGRKDEVQQLGKPALFGISWAIVGGESGLGARPMHPDWARSIRDQCVAAGVAFHFKQWGEWARSRDQSERVPDLSPAQVRYALPDGSMPLVGEACGQEIPIDIEMLHRVGKKSAGRMLDGREWNQFPTVGVQREEREGGVT